MKTEHLVEQIDDAMKFGSAISKKYPFISIKVNHKPPQEMEQDISAAVVNMQATIDRLTPKNSVYREGTTSLISKFSIVNEYVLQPLLGILKSLRMDYQSGYLKSFYEIVHGEIFSDFLDMAEHLLDQKYKDPAAVIAGGALEAHLKKLCEKFNVPTIDAKGKPKAIDTMNTELVKAGAYNLTHQKVITGWAGIRNNAAHGEYDKYSADLVKNMIIGVRSFLAANPA